MLNLLAFRTYSAQDVRDFIGHPTFEDRVVTRDELERIKEDEISDEEWAQFKVVGHR